MTRRLITLFALATLPVLGWAEAFYWVDENGKRHYSDRVPPQESKRERKVIDERGYTVDTLPAEKTDAERQAERQAEEEAAEAAELARRERAERANYDRVLLSTYTHVDEIKKARDDRLGLLDASILVEVQAHADNHNRLASLRKREQELLEKGRPIPNKLRSDIQATLGRISTNEKNIGILKKQRADIEIRYNSDIERYNTLKLAAD